MLKVLPSINQVMLIPGVAELCRSWPRELVVEWTREAVEEVRAEIHRGARLPTGEDGKIESKLMAERVKRRALMTLSPSLKRVVNATGVVIHTNLGRSPLSSELMGAMKDVLGAYSNLEYDLAKGERGSRHVHLTSLIRRVTGAESGLVVNNNAAAVLVVLNTLARGREVVISRGELIEIGGSFRMPDIISRGGAMLREVGTTNRTRVSDYASAITEETALILKVHTSNYRMTGFTEEADLADLVRLGRDRGVPVMMDLGSGLLIDLEKQGLPGEKPVRHFVDTGADVVTFSADKLLGGPQAGFIVGRADVIEDVKRNPLVRALRVGKTTLASLQAMLSNYLSPDEAAKKIPTLALLLRRPESIRRSAKNLADRISRELPHARVEVSRDQALAGGGSLPAQPLPTYVVSIEIPGMEAEDVSAGMRNAPVPVIGRMRSGRFCLDCRTILAGDASHIIAALERVKGTE